MRQLSRLGLDRWLMLAGVLVLVAGVAWAQDPAEEVAQDETSDQAPSPEPDSSGLPFDDLLTEDDLLRPEGYTYDPGGRRDPFRSLVASRARVRERGPRPEGIPGLLIDEIDVTGVFVLAEGPVAQIRSTDQEQSYLLREGDQLFDGDVVSISALEIVFKQIVDDPTAIKPFREVVKRIDMEEGPQ